MFQLQRRRGQLLEPGHRGLDRSLLPLHLHDRRPGRQRLHGRRRDRQGRHRRTERLGGSADRADRRRQPVLRRRQPDTVLPPCRRRLVHAERNRKRWPVGRGPGLLPQRRRRQRLGRLDRRRRQLQPLQLTERLQLELRRDSPRRPLDHRDQRCRDRWNRRDHTHGRLHRPNRPNPHPHRHQRAVLQRGFRDVLAR